MFSELRTYDSKKDTWRMHFHEGQLQAWKSDARFVFILAGKQSGKTSFGPHWLQREIRRQGAGDYLAVTSTFDLFKLKMLPELRLVFEDIEKIGRYWTGSRVIEIAKNCKPGDFLAKQQDDPMWARIILRSADSQTGLASATAKAAWLDEVGQPEFTRESWIEVQGRLARYKGRLLGTTTLYEWNWLKNEVYDKWLAGDPLFDIIQIDSMVNPAFPKDEYERFRNSMPRWKFDLYYRGIYSRPAGLIYDSFNEELCKIKRFTIPDNWLRYVGHDFGMANPAALIIAQDPATGFFYIEHEYLPGAGKSVADHVAALNQLVVNKLVLRRVGGSHQEEEIRQAYSAHGWYIQEPRLHSVEARIDKVYALHKQNKIYVFDDLWKYLDEKLAYSWKLDDEYKPINEIYNKSRFHLMDAEAYILSEFSPEIVDSETNYHSGRSRVYVRR